VKLKEYENDGTQWVYVGQFEDIAECDVAETVRRFQDGNRKFVLIDDDDEYVEEFPP